MADMKRDRRRGPHRDSACRNCEWVLDPYTACRCGASNPSVKLGDRIGGHSDPAVLEHNDDSRALSWREQVACAANVCAELASSAEAADDDEGTRVLREAAELLDLNWKAMP